MVTSLGGFNPAEAEEGFSRNLAYKMNTEGYVSIQPKPKKGLVAKIAKAKNEKTYVSIQPKPKKGLVVGIQNA